jgi:hypothetical protein
VFKLSVSQILLLMLLPLCATSTELRDPMEPYGYRSAGGTSFESIQNTPLDGITFRLSGIFVGPKGNSAVINDRRVYVGEQIDGAQLVTIDPHAVELELQGEKIKIELLPISVKTPAKGLSGGGK